MEQAALVKKNVMGVGPEPIMASCWYWLKVCVVMLWWGYELKTLYESGEAG